MPMYTWSCPCGWRGDLLSGFDQPAACPSCAGDMARDQVYAVNATGFAHVPASERPVPIGRFMEAHDKMTRAASHFEQGAPDVLRLARQQARKVKA